MSRPPCVIGNWIRIVRCAARSVTRTEGQREWNYEAKSGAINLGLDANNAHVQPTGAYHYHGLPTGLMQLRGGDGKKMLLVGYAADGFPIYTSFGHSVATNATSPLTLPTSLTSATT